MNLWHECDGLGSLVSTQIKERTLSAHNVTIVAFLMLIFILVSSAFKNDILVVN